eukprot:UN03867
MYTSIGFFACICVPFTIIFYGDELTLEIAVTICMAIFVTCNGCQNATVLVMINNCAPDEARATVNAFAQLAGDGGRMLAPALSSVTFAYVMSVDRQLYWLCFVLSP